MEKVKLDSEVLELRANVAEAQSAKYEVALKRLMERSDDNVELVNSLRDFIGAIDVKSFFGNSDELMPEGYVNRLSEFFKQKTEELKNLR